MIESTSVSEGGCTNIVLPTRSVACSSSMYLDSNNPAGHTCPPHPSFKSSLSCKGSFNNPSIVTMVVPACFLSRTGINDSPMSNCELSESSAGEPGWVEEKYVCVISASSIADGNCCCTGLAKLDSSIIAWGQILLFLFAVVACRDFAPWGKKMTCPGGRLLRPRM